jgi:hypothetical protein
LNVEDVGVERPLFAEIFGSDGFIQNPAITDDLGNGVRFIAYVTNETGRWELYVRRLVNWRADSRALRVETPGTFDNLLCTRNTFHPRWVPGTSQASLRLLVAMTDCPDNGFEELGPDDDPWSLGELRIWQVEVRGSEL